MDKTKILFVCLGNICRSPAAEGIMKSLVDQEGVENKFVIDSAGTSGWHQGELPDSRMRAHGRKRGYDFSSRSRMFKRDDFEKFDYIIAMDDSNFSNIRAMALTDEDEQKIHRMADYLSQHAHDHIPDPYYSGASGFELVLDLLEDACQGLLKAITKS